MRTAEERAGLLRKARLFATTSDADLLEIANLIDEICVAPHIAVVQKGDLGDCLYIIVDGLVHAHDGALIFNQLHAGDIFGEMAVLDAEVRSATVTTLTQTTLFRLGRQTLHDYIHQSPGLAIGLMQSLTRHLRNQVRERTRDYEYIRQVGQITAAAQAIERSSYSPLLLSEVVQRDDELGQLARVFRHMAAEVQLRERRLQQQLTELRIEVDRERQRRQVSEITGSDYFQQLRTRAASLRGEIEGESA